MSGASPRIRCAAGLLTALLAACASEPVSIEIRPVVDPAAPRVAGAIGYIHPKTFREDLRTVEPYGNQYYLPLRIGEASDRALRAVYARVFPDAREVASPADAKAIPDGRGPVAILEPSIVRFDYLNASARMWGPYYAEIVYAFTLYDSAGARSSEWRITGYGEFDLNRETRERRPDQPRGETALMSEAARRAVEDGVARFVSGFQRIPELMRLARALPLTGANAPAGAQLARAVATGMEVEYPGVLVLTAEPVAVPLPPADLVKEPVVTPPVLALRVTLRNAGKRRLALEPADAHWLPQGASAPVSPAPGRVVSALLAGRPFGLAVGVMSPGVGMLPALFAALISAGENERQAQALTAWTAAIERDLLVTGSPGPGASHGGVLYFPKPATARGGEIVVPVVDLDDAVRYTVRIPLPDH